MANYADVSFDMAVGDDDLLPVDVVIREVTTVNWNSVLASGIRVPPPGDRRLEELWAEQSRRHRKAE